MDIEEIKKDIKFQTACTNLGLDYRNTATCKNAIFVYGRNRNTAVIMDKNYDVVGEDVTIKTDLHFREWLITHDLNFYLFKRALVVETPTLGLYFLLDRNFNCFNIVHSKREETELDFVTSMKYLSYTSPLEDETKDTFMPLSSYSPEMILNIASRVERVRFNDPLIEESNIFFTVNKINYNISANNKHAMMLCFLKYLGEVSKLYFKSLYPLIATGIIDHIPSLGEYLNRVALEIYSNFSTTEEPSLIASSKNIIYKLGQSEHYERFRGLVEHTGKLFESVGFDLTELSAIANSCLALFSLPDEEFRRTPNPIYEVKNESDFELLFVNVEEKIIRFKDNQPH